MFIAYTTENKCNCSPSSLYLRHKRYVIVAFMYNIVGKRRGDGRLEIGDNGQLTVERRIEAVESV